MIIFPYVTDSLIVKKDTDLSTLNITKDNVIVNLSNRTQTSIYFNYL